MVSRIQSEDGNSKLPSKRVRGLRRGNRREKPEEEARKGRSNPAEEIVWDWDPEEDDWKNGEFDDEDLTTDEDLLWDDDI